MAERMTKVETEVTNLKVSNTADHVELKTMLKDFIESADNKYAGKWIEKLNYTVIAGFAAAIVTKIVGLW